MKKIECYLIERANSSTELEKKVAEKIDAGWQPSGPMSVITEGTEVRQFSGVVFYRNKFYQPMIKESE